MKNIFKICLGYFMLNSVAYAQPIKYFDLNIYEKTNVSKNEVDCMNNNLKNQNEVDSKNIINKNGYLEYKLKSLLSNQINYNDENIIINEKIHGNILTNNIISSIILSIKQDDKKLYLNGKFVDLQNLNENEFVVKQEIYILKSAPTRFILFNPLTKNIYIILINPKKGEKNVK